MIFFQLFITFFKIGLFGFGGGYAMLSLIQREVVTHHHWCSSAEFIDMVAISQVTPGPIGINSATYVGYTAVVNAGYSHAMGVLGSFVSTFSVVLPAAVLMLLICKFFLKYRKHPLVEATLKGLRPVVVGLLASATLMLLNAHNFGNIQEHPLQVVVSTLLFVTTFVLFRFYKVNPILLIVVSGVVGAVIYSF